MEAVPGRSKTKQRKVIKNVFIRYSELDLAEARMLLLVDVTLGKKRKASLSLKRKCSLSSLEDTSPRNLAHDVKVLLTGIVKKHLHQ